jgi:hypothetical protein
MIKPSFLRGAWHLCLCAFALPAAAQDLPVPPPILSREEPMQRQSRLSTGRSYSIGQPTGEEQYYLELINRARANPSLEGSRLARSSDVDVLASLKFYNVNLVTLQNEFKALAAQPPLAMNAKLMQAASIM